MNRILLASEAQKISRQIWASFPLQARQVFAMEQLLKFAFGDDLTSLGLAILTAMDNAGIDGQISSTGKSVSDLQALIRKNQASKLKKYADVLGRIVVNSPKGLAGISGEAREKAITHVIILLLSRGFDSGKNFTSALAYVQEALKNRALNNIRDRGRQKELQQGMTKSDIEKFMGDARSLKREVPKKMWDTAMQKVLKDPDLQEEGEPRAFQYIQGQIQGLTESQIAEQMGMSQQALRKWYLNPDRLHTLGKIFEEAYLYLTSESAA